MEQAIATAGLDCQALPDGAGVAIDDGTHYEPDTLVNCGPAMGDNDLLAPNPTVVVEVVSPSSKSIDSNRKLLGYFRVPSIVHYLIVVTDAHRIIHHRRAAHGGIQTAFFANGKILLEPPGILLPVDPMFGG